MDDISIEVDTSGWEELLQALPAKVAGNILRDSLQAAGEVILTAMVAHAPERTDEPTPDSNSLPPGILRADLTTQVQVGSSGPPRVKIGPTEIAGRVARWQNDGWVLTGHGKGKGSRKKIKQIPGKHFIEAAFDESADRAIEVLIERLGSALGQDQVTESTGPLEDYGGEGY